jgi:carbon monoxide dehydrogenase subunit G
VEFDNSFEVPLAPAEAWPLLLDIRRIAPCLPGAELTEVIDEKTYKGRIAVRLGPVALVFAGMVKLEDIDGVSHTARVTAQGSDAKGRGGANATSSFHLEGAGTGTKVLVHTDLALSGAVAQYGRGVGIIQATAAQLMAQFADNLKAQIAAQQTPATPGESPPATAPARPISGFALLARVIWNAIARLFGGGA